MCTNPAGEADLRTRLGTMPQLRQERSKSREEGALPSHATAFREKAWAHKYILLKRGETDVLSHEMELRLGHWEDMPTMAALAKYAHRSTHGD